VFDAGTREAPDALSVQKIGVLSARANRAKRFSSVIFSDFMFFREYVTRGSVLSSAEPPSRRHHGRHR